MGGDEVWVKVNLTKNQWAILKEQTVVMLWEMADTRAEKKRAEEIEKHIDKRMLTNKDIMSLLPVLEDYIETNSDEGLYSVALMYERLKEKLENALKRATKM